MSFAELHKNIKIRLGIQFLISIAANMIFPFLAIYFTEKVGATISGLMLMTIVVAGIIGGFGGGFISDKWGRKKLMMIAEAMMGLTFVIVALVNSPWLDSPYLTFILLTINMLFFGASEPASQAMVIDITTPESRKTVFAAFYWIFNLAFAIGSLTGAFLFKAHRFEMFLALGGITLISVMITWLFIAETYTPHKQKSHSANQNRPVKKTILVYVFDGLKGLIHNYVQVLKDRVFLIYTIAGVLIFSLEFQLSNYIGVRLQQELEGQSLFSFLSFTLELDGFRMLGILQSENTILVVLLMAVVTMAMKRFQDHRVLYTGLLIYTAGYTVLGFAVSPWVLIAAMFIVTIGELMYSPVRQALLGDIAPPDSRSSYVAVNNMTHQVAMLNGSLFIIIGQYLSSYMISGIFVLMGLAGTLLSSQIMKDVYQRRKLEREFGEQTVNS